MAASVAARDGARLAVWGAGGLGVRTAGDVPREAARSDKPLLLVRRLAGGGAGSAAAGSAAAEAFALDSLELKAGELRGRAAVVDSKGCAWDVELAAGVAVGAASAAGLNGRLRWTLRSGSAKGVFVGHRLSLLSDPQDLYVCLPGNVYDGNDADPDIKDIPRVSRTGVLEVATTSLASPCAAFHARSSGVSFVLSTAQRAGGSRPGGASTGFIYDVRDPVRPTIAATAPIFRSLRYHLRNLDGSFRFHMVPEPTPGADLEPGDWIELPLSWSCGVDPDLASFFRRLHGLRPAFRGPHRRRRDLPLSEAASMVSYNQNRYHWQEDRFYSNAAEVDGRNANQLLSGWCSGIITGYGLLGCGDAQSRERAVKMIDFTCATGVSPSGLFYGAYQDGKWDPGQEVPRGQDITPWRHIRTSEDGTFYLLRAYALEKRHGKDRPAWLAAARSNIDSMLRLWNRYGEFGLEVDRLTGEMTLKGSAAGTLCIACLAEGSSLFGERAFLEAARDAADSYYERFIAAGHTTGGPLDVWKAQDSESCLMFPPSFLSVYQQTGDSQYLRYAVDAADQLASWVLSWDGSFPPGSTLDLHRVQTIGGVIASAQNHHVGPGGATTSFSSLLGIYKATGEERFLALLEDCATALQQYLSRHDGHISRLAKGMMTEQINLADALNHDQGEIWNISASWGATNILLTRTELPGVYVDPARRRCAALDHVEARADWDRKTVAVHNPTEFEARTSVEIEGSPLLEVTLAPGAGVDVAFRGGTVTATPGQNRA